MDERSIVISEYSGGWYDCNKFLENGIILNDYSKHSSRNIR